MEVNLRTIECAVAFVNHIIQTHFIQSAAQTIGSHLPVLVASHAVFRSGRQLYMILETKQAVYTVNQLCNTLDFLFDLLRSHEDMSIILSKAAHTHQTMKLAGFLMTVNQTQLAQTKGQITVGTGLRCIYKNTARAVHGFYRIILLINNRGVHIIFIVIPVTGGLPQASV